MTSQTAARRWWLEAGLTGYLGFRPGANRETFIALGGTALVALFVEEIFRHAGLAAASPTGNLANVAGLLTVVQILCLAGSRPGWRSELFQDPPGPLLPFTAAARLMLWTLRTILPIALGLAVAYTGVLAGLAAVPATGAMAAWFVDLSALSAAALGLELSRWLFRTYAPLALRHAWALIAATLLNAVPIVVGLLGFAVALQFGLRGVFVSAGVTSLLRDVAASIATRPESAAMREALVQRGSSLERFESMSAMSALVTEGRAPDALVLLLCGVLLALLLGAVLVLPGRRPEEQDRIVRFAFFARELATRVTVTAWPRGYRVAWRLMLPPLQVGLRYAAAGAVTLTMAAAFVTWADLSPAGDPKAVARVLVAYGGVLVVLLALAHANRASALGLDADHYVRFATLPTRPDALIRRMLLIATLCGGMLDGLLALTWSLVVQRDAAAALLFTTGIVLVLAAALAGYAALTAAWWSSTERLEPVVARVWPLLVAAILIWQFHALGTRPEVLARAAIVEGLAALAAWALAWIALTRMARRREPAAAL